MPTSPTRYALLQSRLARVAGLLGRVEKNEASAVPLVRTALRRLCELLPVLQIDPETARRLGVRLRKTARRLGRVREFDACLGLLDDVAAADRRTRSGATCVARDVRRRRLRLDADAVPQKAVADARRALRKLNAVMADLRRTGDSSAGLRAMRWAVKARLARRAATLKREVDAAGSVYLPGRLRNVGKAVRKLRFTADLVGDVVPTSSAPTLDPIEHTQDALDRLRLTVRLIDRARRLQGAVSPPDLKAWQELDALVMALENRCRRLHARYVLDRGALVALCDRFGARASASDAPKRKAS